MENAHSKISGCDFKFLWLQQCFCNQRDHRKPAACNWNKKEKHLYINLDKYELF